MSIFWGFMFLIKPRRLTILAKLLINIIKTTNLNVNQYLTIRLSTCLRTWHSLVTNMSTNSPLSGYQNVYEHGTLRLPTCQRTVHYPLSKCQQIWTKIDMINTKINKATIFTLAVRTQYSGGETTSSRRIQLIANMHLIDVFSHQRLYIHSIGTCAPELSYWRALL